MGFELIDRLWARIQSASGFRFSHILEPSIDQTVLAKRHDAAHFYCVRDDVRMQMPSPDKERLAALEQPGVPTIHNMIMSDRVTRTLDYMDALSYATYLEQRFVYLFSQIKPSVIIGGFDGLHSGIAMAVARSLGIPWFAINFTTIPPGLTGFCTGMTPDTGFTNWPSSPEVLQALAEKTLHEFETQRLVAPLYISANNIYMVIKRMPRHFKAFYEAIFRMIALRSDKFTQYSARRLAMEYIRKRRNMLLLPKEWFCDTPPATPYLFIGLHMQPESSIDVWAPFFSDQISVIEAISRSTPPTHQILVKLHKSDADNYSRRQLDRLRRLPGVRLVSPFAQSRIFIENASLVLAIQGNIALEAAMLGRPVLVFGDTKFMDLPSVTRVNRTTDLPAQIRSKLSEKPPAREAILCGLMSYLSRYAPGCYNNWEVTPSAAEISNMVELFKALREYVEKSDRCAG
jgi:hypothetical protein